MTRLGLRRTYLSSGEGLSPSPVVSLKTFDILIFMVGGDYKTPTKRRGA
jgi:hypothetical protein